MYITPDRFRSSGFGIDLTGVEDVELRSTIQRASAIVNAYCAVPMQPTQYDFRGGSITGEQMPWRLGNPYEATTIALGSRRVFPKHRPIRTITSFVVKFTNTYSVTIDPSDIYINSDQGWAEVVSLASVVSGVYPVGINFGLYTPVAEVSYTYGWRFAVTSEWLEPTDAGVYRAVNGSWATSPAPVIYKNGAVQSSGYTVDSVEGTVTFAVLLDDDDVVTASYTYTLPSAIAEATALITAHLLGERELEQRGMAGVALLSVAEVEIRRPTSSVGGRTVASEIEPEVAALLAPFIYVTVR